MISMFWESELGMENKKTLESADYRDALA